MLLIALWVRSYAYRDEVGVPYGAFGYVMIRSYPGFLLHYVLFDTPQVDYYPYRISFEPLYKPPPLSWRTMVPGIHLLHDPQEMQVELPFWFLTLVTGAFMYLPWVKWHFSLRTLLIAMTVISALLGLIVSIS